MNVLTYGANLIMNVKTNTITKINNIKINLKNKITVYCKYVVDIVENLKQKDAIVVFNKKINIVGYKNTLNNINIRISNIIGYTKNKQLIYNYSRIKSNINSIFSKKIPRYNTTSEQIINQNKMLKSTTIQSNIGYLTIQNPLSKQTQTLST